MKRFLRVVTLLTLLSSVTFRVWASPAITISETHTNLVCNGRNDGSIQISPSGGVAPYTFYWGGTDTTQNQSNLAAGSYTVLVTDHTGATATATINISQPTPYNITKSITNENCGGQHVGAITLHVTGNTPAYSYRWATGDTTSSLSNLTAAVYYVTVTDANGCSTTDSCNVTQPPGVAITMTISAVSCSAGMSNGAIAVSVQYGNPGYQYLWNDGTTTQNRAGLTMGNYVLTVTDAIGCTAIDTANVGDLPGSMSINATTTNPTCYHGSNGTITITSVVGSTAPYIYVWNDAVTTQNRSGLAAGTYTVTATSSTGCTTSSAFTVGQPAQINLTPHVVPPTCYQSSNGAISVTSSGGNSPYSYLWSTGGFTSSISGLAVGSYSVTVTDFKGCTVTSTSVLTAPQVLVTATPTQLTCNGGPTGSIITNTSGGTTPYSYWWGAGVVSANRININSGNYTVTVTDAHGCTATANAVIAPYAPMSLTAAVQNALCYNDSNGVIAMSVANGQGPFSYAWNDGESTSEIDFLPTGTYSVTVTDAKSCTATATNSITAPPFSITVNSTISDVSCFGLSNGSIALNPLNGSPPYNYKWNGNQTSPSISNLAVGTYYVTITDNNGCKAVSSFSVTQPLLITPVAVPVNASCFGTATGAINLSVTGGYSPFSYTWNDGVNLQSRTNLQAGAYTVTITDNHACTATSAATVSQPALLTIGATGTNPSCAAGSNGVITVTTAGGTTPYTFNWGGGITAQSRSALSAGTYTVTETDANGCSVSASAILVAPSPISISSSTTSVACNGGNTGTITLTVSGGTAPYTYDWGGGVTTQNRSNLTSGTYTVTVTDQAGCSATASAVISGATNLAVTTSVTNVTCFGINNGIALATATGGTTPYAFSWANGNTTNQRSNLAAGNYVVTVTDHVGCSASAAASVTQPAMLSVSSSSAPANCNGSAGGAINISVNGGVSPYAYAWAGGVTTQNRSNLTAGSYTLTVTDNAGCTVTNSSIVTQPTGLVITNTKTNALCNGAANGTIQTLVTGGTGAYNYNWGGGVLTQNRTGLAAGNYSVTVNDANSCSAVGAVIITQPTAVSITATANNVSCFGQNSGGVNLTVSGGTGAYTYSWAGGQTTQNLTAQGPGVYSVTVTDANNCSASASASVTQPTQISTSINSINNASCYGAANGGINIQINGGTPAYNYVWSNGSTQQNLTGVVAGTYRVSVSDAHGCTTSTSINVTQPNQITFTSSVTNVACFGNNTGSILTSVSGGNGGFNYTWNNGNNTPDISYIAAGNYTLTVQDIMNCTASFSVQVNQPPLLTLVTTQTNVVCNGGNTGTATANVSGGAGNYIYNWSNGQTTSQITQLGQGLFRITATDANSCSVSATVNISQINSISLSLNTTNVNCNGQNNGSAHAVVTGGALPYQYVWTNNATTATISALAAGTYAVTVTDGNHCNASATANITQPAIISVSPTVTNLSCFGAGNGGIQTTATGGTGSLQYLWNNNATTSSLSNIAAGNYSVTVTDTHACSATASMTVTQPTQVGVTLSKVDATCFGSNSGSVSSLATGGTGVYNYLWNNAATTANISALLSGSYSLTVSDAAGCSATASANIGQPTAVSLTTSAVNVLCNGGNNGSASAQVSGGTGSYNFNWSNHATAQQITQLTAGTYPVTVSDANGCSVTGSAVVTQPAVLAVSSTQSNYACANKEGLINVSTTGGTSPYTYVWQDGSTLQNRTSLIAGTYSVTVSDQHQCSKVTTVTINQLPQMSTALSSTSVSCYNGTNGSISISVTGGTQPLSFSWNNAATTTNLQNVPAGSYNVVVTDLYGCTASATGTISQPAAIQLATQMHQPECYGQSTGLVRVAVTGGVTPYAYNWNTSSTLDSITNVTAGNYQVTITDGNGCSATSGTIALTQPAQLAVNTVVTPVGCSGMNDGSVLAQVAGGTPPYNFNWSTSAKTVQIDSLAAGNYTLTVSDNNGCLTNKAMTVSAAAPLTLSSTVQNTSCSAVENGSMSISVTGGTSPYNYNWSNGQTASSLNGIGNGYYAVTVTDNKGCSASTGDHVLVSYELSVHAATSSANGQVQLSAVTNVDHSNAYSWSPANVLTCSNCATTTAMPQQSTLFTINVTDANGCKASDTVSVEVNNAVTEVFIPNAFTPNGDGVNDQFKIFGDLAGVHFIDLAIFDKWGEKVFESNNPNFEWDGIYKGQAAPLGVYVYTATIVYDNGKSKDYKGSVTLLR